jgi:hypothetical protein
VEALHSLFHGTDSTATLLHSVGRFEHKGDGYMSLTHINTQLDGRIVNIKETK